MKFFQVAGLQGYLLKNKTRPRECVDEVHEWIIQERETREKLKKEKAEVSFYLAGHCFIDSLHEFGEYSVRPRRKRKPKKRRKKR